jgi:hypothetical protein
MNPQAEILKQILDLDNDKGISYPKEWIPYDEGMTKAGETYIHNCIENKQYPTGRFRDIYLNEDGSKIILYTRNGGGNREGYFWVFDILKQHPNYIRDYDDDFDCTYAYIEFSVPEEAKEFVKGLVTGEKPLTVAEKFEKTMEEMKGMSKEELEKDKRFKPIIDTFKKMVDPENKETIFKV